MPSKSVVSPSHLALAQTLSAARKRTGYKARKPLPRGSGLIAPTTTRSSADDSTSRSERCSRSQTDSKAASARCAQRQRYDHRLPMSEQPDKELVSQSATIATTTLVAARITPNAARTIVARSNPRLAASRLLVVAWSSETALTTMTARNASDGCSGGFLSSRRRNISAGPSAVSSAYDLTPTDSSTMSEKSAMPAGSPDDLTRLSGSGCGHSAGALAPVTVPHLNGPQNGPQGALCGPSASQSPPSIHEMPRTLPREPQRFRGFSPVFAGARGSLTNRGAQIRTGDLTDPNRE